MSKITDPILPSSGNTADLLVQLNKYMRQVSQQLNSLSEGRMSAVTNAATTAPADGTGNPGDFVARKGSVASGPVGAQYVVSGWRCVATGSTPATQWVEVLENVRVPPPTAQPTPAPTSTPAPVSAPTPYSQKIQAENATLHNIGVVTYIPAYEGTGHADWFRSGYDEYLEFSFTGCPSSASGDLKLSFATYGTGGNQTCSIIVNGTNIGRFTYPATNSIWTLQTVSGVSFVAGTNTVRLTPDYSGYTFFDWASFTQTTSAPPPPPPPPPAPAPSSPAPAPAAAPGTAPYYPFGSRIDLAKATITTPVAPTATPSTTGGSLAAGTYYFKIVAIDSAGKNTAAGPEASATTTGTTGSVALSWTAVTSAASYQIFFATSSGGQLAYFTSATNSFTFTTTGSANTGTPAGQYPFGIKVSNQTHAQMDAAVQACYDKWKLARLAKSPKFVGNAGIFSGQTITDGYHVQWGTADYACVSEGIGYGMLICVLMAGYDPNAQTYFNGLFRVARGRTAYAVPYGGTPSIYLMDYKLFPDMSSAGEGYNAADGDLDIALSLLMAHRQWGSSGTYNYYQEALNTINAIKSADFSSNGLSYGPQNASRVSDYMAGHFRSFKAATNDTFWDNARTNSLAVTQTVTTNYSPSAHLQPGFIYDPLGSNPRPDTVARIDRSGIEDIYDQNSVRNPWRWATDFVYSGDTGWGNLTKGIVTQMQSSSGGSASGFSYAYKLDGTPVSGLYHDGSQAGCVMAGCMVDATFQTFLNTLYASNIGSGYDTRYYYAELMLLPLILASGNWWRV